MTPTRLALLALVALAPPCDAAERTPIPAEFVRDQVIVTPAIDGRTLRFFTDTGGGWNALSSGTAASLGLDIESVEGGEDASQFVAFPTFDADASIPAPGPHFANGKLQLGETMHAGADGFLGGRWFADRTWEIDYPRRRFHLLHGHVDDPGHPHRMPLQFQLDGNGERTMHFPRIDVGIDGEVLSMLLDTGATATATASSAAVFGVDPGDPIGTSFIEHEVFERWHRRHPDWRVLENADQKAGQQRRMIEVPEIRIGGHVVGPAWFAEQPPGSFQRYLAQWMDQPTWGALGGSALRHFRVVIDYPNAAATFHRDAGDESVVP